MKCKKFFFFFEKITELQNWQCPTCGATSTGALSEKEHYQECMLKEIVKGVTRDLQEKDRQINKLKAKLRKKQK